MRLPLEQLARAHIQRRGPRWWVTFEIGASCGSALANAAAARLLFDVRPEWCYAW